MSAGVKAAARAAATALVLATAISCAPGDLALPPAAQLGGPAPAAAREQPVVVPPDSRDDSSYFASALAQLDTLPIKGRAPKTGYDRAEFGPAWSDNVTVEGGKNGCDTRNDELGRELLDKTIKPGTHGCVVLSGTFFDPYSGTTVDFQRGQATSSLIQLDHVVPLMDAWQKGAQQWSADKRRDFANDPVNLQLTIGKLNSQKGAGDAATWLPPDKSYRCTYVSRIVNVKATYGLWVTQAEHNAIADILTGCAAG